MIKFIPFIHKKVEKKKNELEPLYQELYPLKEPEKKKDAEDETSPGVIIIELF